MKVYEQIMRDSSPCKKCEKDDDNFVKLSSVTIEDFNIAVETCYCNPCGYRHSVMRVNGKQVAESVR